MRQTRLIATILHMKRTLAVALTASIALTIPFASTSASASIKPGSKCTQLNQMKAASGLSYICVQKGKKLTWANQAVHYKETKLKAYSEIRSRTDSGNLDNVTLVYHASNSFPKDLKKLYTRAASSLPLSTRSTHPKLSMHPNFSAHFSAKKR